MEKTYDPQSIEKKWYQTWENAGYFKPNMKDQPAYCIMLPPPNVTGSLHMGHGFQDTLMDSLIRYHRMCGENTLWQAGTDHAGIATQMVVERQLLAQGKNRHDLGRDVFVEKVWEWKQQSGNQISQQLRRMGTSMDWSRERFSMDSGFTRAVQEVFLRLYEEGLIYRGLRLVNWDPHLHTAISDLEVISEDVKGQLWYIRYPLADSNQHIIVATTRPETMLGDVAVAVNPTDERYQNLIGKMIKLPLTDRTIPIIADDAVDKEFGTGCVKITPAHDFNDYAMAQRHDLPMINIFTKEAALNENVPKKYQDLDRFVAREKIVADLQAQELLEKIEPHQLKIPRGDRSGVVIEPYLTYQWFMKMEPLAKPALEAVRAGEIRFVPDNWSKTYFQWLEKIEDWCISRQLWWGHRIPAWFDTAENIYVGHDEADIRKKYQLADSVKLTQDSDVLDTWFSAALWPFVSLGWPEPTKEFQTYYPTNVLVTGFDIIFFWVARMIMLGLKFTGKIPFKEVYVTGLIRDHEGHKMSKSKGNVLDPIDLIDGIDLDDLVNKRTSGLMQPAMAEKITQATRKHFPEGIPAFGTDALRFTYCALASNNREIRFDLNRVQGYRNFCNKLWNAARFVLMNTEDKGFKHQKESYEFNEIDLWIQSRLQHTIKAVHQHLTSYRFDLVTQAIYEFVWDEYCDWYLELSKPLLNHNDINKQNATRYTLLSVLETILRLAHPFMPFITEEIWQRVAPLLNISGETIMLQSYPEYIARHVHETAETEIIWLKNVILNIRTIRSEMMIAPSKTIPLLLSKGNDNDKTLAKKYQTFLMNIAKLASINWLDENTPAPKASMAIVGNLQLLIPLEGLIDVDAETKRLQKELEKINNEIERLRNKLENANFVANAPQDIVEKEKAKLAEFTANKAKITNQLAAFSA